MMYLLKNLLTFSTGASKADSVFQTPPFIIRRIGESVEGGINCSHSVPNYEVILWYKQDEHRALKLLGYLNMQYPNPEDDVREKISFDGDGRKHSSLTISSLSSTDSGVYFCAASRHSAADSFKGNTKTLINVQAPEHLLPAAVSTKL